MVSLPAVSTGSVAAAHASAEADGATEGAVVAAAVEAVGPVVGAAADGLAPPLVHAVARIANRPRVKVIVLRTSCFLPGCWDARECTCGVPGMPKRRGHRPSRDGADAQRPPAPQGFGRPMPDYTAPNGIGGVGAGSPAARRRSRS